MAVPESVQACLDELGRASCLTPRDILEELSPLTQLYYTQQMVDELLRSYAARTDPDDPDAVALEESVGVALAGITTASGNLMAACIAMGVFPTDDDAGSGGAPTS